MHLVATQRKAESPFWGSQRRRDAQKLGLSPSCWMVTLSNESATEKKKKKGVWWVRGLISATHVGAGSGHSSGAEGRAVVWFVPIRTGKKLNVRLPTVGKGGRETVRKPLSEHKIGAQLGNSARKLKIQIFSCSSYCWACLVKASM